MFIPVKLWSYQTFCCRRKVTAEHVLHAHAQSADPRSVLVEGASGTGKSTLCHYLAQGWATGSIPTLSR